MYFQCAKILGMTVLVAAGILTVHTGTTDPDQIAHSVRSVHATGQRSGRWPDSLASLPAGPRPRDPSLEPRPHPCPDEHDCDPPPGRTRENLSTDLSSYDFIDPPDYPRPPVSTRRRNTSSNTSTILGTIAPASNCRARSRPASPIRRLVPGSSKIVSSAAASVAASPVEP